MNARTATFELTTTTERYLMIQALRFMLTGACIAAMAGCGGGEQDPVATPDAAAAAATAAAASASASAGVRPLVVPASMVAQVKAPPKPNNGKLVVNPGIRQRELHESPATVPAGTRGTRTPLSGG
jgi:hypothetical protein